MYLNIFLCPSVPRLGEGGVLSFHVFVQQTLMLPIILNYLCAKLKFTNFKKCINLWEILTFISYSFQFIEIMDLKNTGKG